MSSIVIMKSKPLHIPVFCAALGALMLTACTSPDRSSAPTAGAEQQAPELSATKAARKSLALLYLENAEVQLDQLNDPAAQRQTRLTIANTYALLGERQEGLRNLPPPPPLPNNDVQFNANLQYLAILAALGEHGQLDAMSKQLDDRRAEELIRGYAVYYDATLHRPHLEESLENAADAIGRKSAPHAFFYLALGYQFSGEPEMARQTCLMPTDPYSRFVACTYMAAAMQQYNNTEAAAFYLDEAMEARSRFTASEPIDPYTQMIYGRVLAMAGDISRAAEIYVQLDGKPEVMHVGAAIAQHLIREGRMSQAKTITRDVQAKFAAYQGTASDRSYLYNSFGDFLVTLELYKEFNAELKQTRDPLLKANLFAGGAESLADTLMYGR